MEQQTNSRSGYGKRPIWQWVLLYVVIGGIAYGAIYYFMSNGNAGSYNTNTPYVAPTQTGQSTQTPANSGTQNNPSPSSPSSGY